MGIASTVDADTDLIPNPIAAHRTSLSLSDGPPLVPDAVTAAKLENVCIGIRRTQNTAVTSGMAAKNAVITASFAVKNGFPISPTPTAPLQRGRLDDIL